MDETMTSDSGIDNHGFQDDSEHKIVRVPSRRAQIYVQKKKYGSQNYFDFNSTSDWDYPENPNDANTTYNHSLPKGRRRRDPMSHSTSRLDAMNTSSTSYLNTSPVRSHAHSWNETPGDSRLLKPRSAMSLARANVPGDRKTSLTPSLGSRKGSYTIERERSGSCTPYLASYDPEMGRKGSYTLTIGSEADQMQRKGSLRAADIILETQYPRLSTSDLSSPAPVHSHQSLVRDVVINSDVTPNTAKPRLERSFSKMESPRVIEKRLAAFVRQISIQRSTAPDPQQVAPPKLVVTHDEAKAGLNEKPAKTYFDLALFSCICCLSPLGFIAIFLSVLSRNAHGDADYTRSTRYSMASCGLSISGIIISILLVVAVLILVAYPVVDFGDYYYWDLTTVSPDN